MAAVLLAVTGGGARTAINPTTMGFVYLVAVVFLSIWSGLRVGIAASLLATACYNFFFLPPLHTLHIDDPRNWVALTTFLLAALVVTRLVLAARAQAAEAERRRLEGEANAYIELLRQSDAFKTSLLRAVSHDLTTPLTVIRIQTSALERHAAATPELRQTVRAIAEETARLHRRIESLLTMARLESGRFHPHPEPTPPADIFHAVRKSVPSIFTASPVTIAVPPGCPDVYVDPSLALEIMVNLLENAQRASRADAPIELAAVPSGARVLLEVRDRGHGIALDSDVVRNGLGLEIARGLTSASMGVFTIESRDGGGTVARADFPAAAVSDAPEDDLSASEDD
jgi:two-component system sensor histidine kinase KdpD